VSDAISVGRVFHFALAGSVPDTPHADHILHYEKGDISNVVSKGTFLMSVDSCDPGC
jgi:hypothetical protein